MSEDIREGGILGQIIVAVAVALLVGGTAPWWWDKIFSGGAKNRTEETSTSEVIAEDNEYMFQLQNCKRSNKKVKCNFMITNMADKDRYLRLWVSGSRTIADTGDVFPLKEVQFGIKSGSSAGETLPTNIPIKGSIIFEEIPEKIKNFSRLEIRYDGAGSDPSGRFITPKITVQ